MIENNDLLSRRSFLELSASALGIASLASMNLSQAWADNIVKVDTKNMIQTENEVDVLVIGGGMAGLFAAVKAYDAGAKVMLVSKGRVGTSGQTPFAKGIFSFDEKKEKLSIDEFVEKFQGHL